MPNNESNHRIIEDAQIGKNTYIWNFTHVRSGAIIGDNCNIGNNVYIDSDVIIGNNVKVQNGVNIYKGLEIGNDVFIGPSVTFTNDVNPRSFIWSDDKITDTYVEDGVSIGANATIRCGITLGKYSMVGAGSVVTKNVPPFTVVMGNPAKFYRFVKVDGNIIKDYQKNIVSEDELFYTMNIDSNEFKIKKSFIQK